MNSPSDKNKSTSGNVEATVRAYDRELHGFLMRRLGGCKELSEDIRQEIYLRIWRFSDTDLVREPRAYLFRVARNVLHDKLLLAERERETFGASNDAIAEAITEDHASHTDNERDLQRILSRLPKLHRAILLLRTAQGLSYSEIAKELQLSEHTVKKYMHLALVNARLISLELK